MTDIVIVIHSNIGRASTPVRVREWTGSLLRAIQRATRAYRIRRALDDLPGEFLRDVGLTRSDIGFAAAALVSGKGDITRDPLHQLNRSIGKARRLHISRPLRAFR